MDDIELFNKVVSNDFNHMKNMIERGDYPNDKFWALIFNHDDFKLIKDLSDYFSGSIGFNFSIDCLRLFYEGKVDGDLCYKILFFGLENNYVNKADFKRSFMEEAIYQVLSSGDGAFKVISFFTDNSIDFHSETALFSAIEHGAEKTVKLLLENINYDNDTLGEALNHVYHTSETNETVVINIFNSILKYSPSLDFNEGEFESHLLDCLFVYTYLFDSIIGYDIKIEDLNEFDCWQEILEETNEIELIEMVNNLNKVKDNFDSEKLLEAANKNNHKLIIESFS
ncbi:hypothetical protein MHO82_23750 [Vibrio sp. Of7-15]|uniref:hypothetical protein n=1 Tax=Vibrio sp. Of7-15 TaxID=2724879 RepID=UPI001EF3179E|nr:hypothetical protein [Vibrio sp. Of7-15]MCG7499885.1 hypothetical protein [Vibrio sp. Of7-15]